MCRETWGREDRVWETLKGAMTGWDVDCSCSGVKINVQSHRNGCEQARLRKEPSQPRCHFHSLLLPHPL